jgi:anti-sigma B factor antagonist
MLNLEIKKTDDTVSLNGEIDLGNCNVFKERINEIIDETDGMLVLDFEGLSYIDSAGLGILVGIYKRLNEKGRKLRIRQANDYIKKLFHITKLDTLLDIV